MILNHKFIIEFAAKNSLHVEVIIVIIIHSKYNSFVKLKYHFPSTDFINNRLAKYEQDI